MSLLPKKTRGHSPFSVFDDGFNSLMDDFLLPRRAVGVDQRLVPRIDVKETETAFQVKADLPGMKKEDIELTLQDGVLSISATRDDEHKEEADGELLHRERIFGRYVRNISLGNRIDENSVHASFEDGVLEVTVPKLESGTDDKVRVAIK